MEGLSLGGCAWYSLKISQKVGFIVRSHLSEKPAKLPVLVSLAVLGTTTLAMSSSSSCALEDFMQEEWVMKGVMPFNSKTWN